MLFHPSWPQRLGLLYEGGALLAFSRQELISNFY